jgi:hypothetical protein
MQKQCRNSETEELTMQKEEFVQHLNDLPENTGRVYRYEDFPDDLYREIEFVYNWHPGIGNKDDIARMYYHFGIWFIRNFLFEQAEKAKKEEEESRKIQALRDRIFALDDERAKLVRELSDLTGGGM